MWVSIIVATWIAGGAIATTRRTVWTAIDTTIIHVVATVHATVVSIVHAAIVIAWHTANHWLARYASVLITTIGTITTGNTTIGSLHVIRLLLLLNSDFSLLLGLHFFDFLSIFIEYFRCLFISFSLVFQFLLKFPFLFYQLLDHLCCRGRSRRLTALLIYCATRAVRVVRIA